MADFKQILDVLVINKQLMFVLAIFMQIDHEKKKLVMKSLSKRHRILLTAVSIAVFMLKLSLIRAVWD